MVGKMPHVIWLQGAFVESDRGRQSGWFYITEPRDPVWGAAPEFQSVIPTRLTSWKETGLSWGNPAEVTGLQTCIKDLIGRKVKLVTVVQVMLFRRILPCQRRAFNLWEFDPAQHQTLSRLFVTMHEDAWKVLFKCSEVPPPVTEDRGICAKRQASAVS